MLSTAPHSAKTPAERLMVAASLPESMRAAFFHEKSKVPGAVGWTADNDEAVAWLPAMTALGMATLRAIDQRHLPHPIPILPSMAKQAEQSLLSFMAFMPHCQTHVTDQDPIYGQMNHTSKVLVPWTHQALRDAFSAHNHVLSAQIDDLRKDNVFVDNPSLLGEVSDVEDVRLSRISPAPGHLVPVLSAWVGTLCLLDLPQDVARFAKACPEALQCTIPVDLMGPGFAANIHVLTKKKRADVSPFLCALNASSIDCMNALRDAGVEASPELVKIYADDEPRAYRLSTVFEAAWPTCYPFAFSHAVQALADVGPKQAVVALEAMLQTAGGARGRAPLAEGLVHAGMLDSRPDVAIGWALTNGQPNILTRFAHDFPWNLFQQKKHGISGYIHMAGSPGLLNEASDRSKCENALIKLFEIARRDGKEKEVFETYSWINADAKQGSPAPEIVLQPFCSLAKSGFTRAVAAYVNHGLDVYARPDERTATPMAFIKSLGKKGHEVAHAVRTAINHAAAHKMLQDMMDEEPAIAVHSRP